jgi:hypothetical protein
MYNAQGKGGEGWGRGGEGGAGDAEMRIDCQIPVMKGNLLSSVSYSLQAPRLHCLVSMALALGEMEELE